MKALTANSEVVKVIVHDGIRSGTNGQYCTSTLAASVFLDLRKFSCRRAIGFEAISCVDRRSNCSDGFRDHWHTLDAPDTNTHNVSVWMLRFYTHNSVSSHVFLNSSYRLNLGSIRTVVWGCITPGTSRIESGEIHQNLIWTR